MKGTWIEQLNVYDFIIKDFGEFKKDGLDKFFGIPGKTLFKIKSGDEYRVRFSNDIKSIKIWEIVCDKVDPKLPSPDQVPKKN